MWREVLGLGGGKGWFFGQLGSEDEEESEVVTLHVSSV